MIKNFILLSTTILLMGCTTSTVNIIVSSDTKTPLVVKKVDKKPNGNTTNIILDKYNAHMAKVKSKPKVIPKPIDYKKCKCKELPKMETFTEDDLKDRKKADAIMINRIKQLKKHIDDCKKTMDKCVMAN